MENVVYYKSKCEKNFKTISIGAVETISVWDFKVRLVKFKNLDRGSDYDLKIFNAVTEEEYCDESLLIHANTRLIVQRVAWPSLPIVLTDKKQQQQEQEDTTNGNHHQQEAPYDFGDGSYIIPEEKPVVLPPQPSKEEEDKRIKALVSTSALGPLASKWQWRRDATKPAMGAGAGGRLGRCRILENKTPPPGYICHRCKKTGHFLQYCPTNGDPDYNMIKVPPSRIPVPDEAAFDKQMEGIGRPSSVRPADIPPELMCPICKEPMRDAVLTSKCCYGSFCDGCIRNHIISSNSVCFCGANGILADYLLPNRTLRDTIKHYLEAKVSSPTLLSVTPTAIDKTRPKPSPPLPHLPVHQNYTTPSASYPYWDANGIQFGTGGLMNTPYVGAQAYTMQFSTIKRPMLQPPSSKVLPQLHANKKSQASAASIDQPSSVFLRNCFRFFDIIYVILLARIEYKL